MRDIVPERIAELGPASVPIYEPGLEELIARNGERLAVHARRARGARRRRVRLRLRRDAADAVGRRRPLARSGRSSTSCPSVDHAAILVMKSTVPVGTGEKVRAALDARGLADVGYVSNPEFTAEGTRGRGLHAPRPHRDRRVRRGGRRRGRAAPRRLDAPVVRTDVTSAEMIKFASNAFLSTRISFINEIANVCEATGADVSDVARGIGLDHRLGPHFLHAGIGYGGRASRRTSLALKQLAGN